MATDPTNHGGEKGRPLPRTALASRIATLAMVGLLVVITALPAHATRDPSLVAWAFSDERLTPFLRRVHTALDKALRKGSDFEVLNRRTWRRNLAKFSRRCRTIGTDECLDEVRQRVEASYLLAIHLGRDKRDAQASLWLIATGDGRVIAELDGLVRRRHMADDCNQMVATLLEKMAAAQTPALADGGGTASDQPSPSEAPEASTGPAPPPAPPPPPPPELAANPESVPTPGEGATGPETPPAQAPPQTVEPAVSEANAPLKGDEQPWADDPRHPLVLHAEALLLEIDGDSAGAMTLLRNALSTTGTEVEPDVAFTLARMALEHGSDRFATDVKAFMALPRSADKDARLLRAYVAMQRGDQEAARQDLEGLPADSEVSSLRRSLSPQTQTQAQDEDRITGYFRLGSQADSNVTVAPDVPTGEAGIQATTQGFLRVTPLHGPQRLDLELSLNYMPHLYNRDALGAYDVAAGSFATRFTHQGELTIFMAQVAGSEVFIDSFAQHFMQTLGVDLELLFKVGGMRLGIYGRSAYRDFLGPNPEGRRDPDDRDGTALEAGLVAAVVSPSFSCELRAAGDAELVEGRRQRERGARAVASISWRPADWSLQVRVAYHLRHYPRAKQPRDGVEKVQLDPEDYWPNRRWDHRFTPSLRVSYSVTEWLAASASYLFVYNLSTHPFDYQRHLGTLAMEARW